jgi:hypothetical protein
MKNRKKNKMRCNGMHILNVTKNKKVLNKHNSLAAWEFGTRVRVKNPNKKR